jgi:hypothetical protein
MKNCVNCPVCESGTESRAQPGHCSPGSTLPPPAPLLLADAVALAELRLAVVEPDGALELEELPPAPPLPVVSSPPQLVVANAPTSNPSTAKE